uniref:Uncharacterized protein n=1 Tax=Parascaris equorum TaxID=6256 RepID=A0A914R1J7_PAREQ
MTNPQTRETSFIHGSTQYQVAILIQIDAIPFSYFRSIISALLVAETYLVAVLYAAVTAGFILLNDAADGKGDPNRRRS